MMNISKSLLDEFAKTISGDEQKENEYLFYATVHSIDIEGNVLVDLDGSDNLTTPCETTVNISENDRVIVSMKNRQATIVANVSSKTINADFLEAGSARIAGELIAATGTFAGELQAATGTFAGSLSAATGSFTGSVTATSFAAKDNIQIYDGSSNRYHVALQFGANAGGYALDMLTINPNNGFSNGVFIQSALAVDTAIAAIGTIASQTGMYAPAFINTSDERVKHGIKDSKVNNALDRIKEIKHREFYWDENNVYVPIGYIAQELEKIDSGMVSIMPNGMYGVNSTYIISLLTKAVQELSDKVDELERRLENVESEHN